MMTSLLRRLDYARRANGANDEGAALITALMAILLTATFAIALLGVLLSQSVPTQLQEATTRTIFGAEAGVNAAVGQIRNATGAVNPLGEVFGDRNKLPCTVEGSVNDGADDVGYTVSLSYYTEDPTGKDAAWRSINALICTPGLGPNADPSYAVITSNGNGLSVGSGVGDPDRTVEVIYAFQVTNVNIPGGLIYSFDVNQNPRFCLEAEGPVAGATIKYIAYADCGTNEALQLWLYDTDYRIKLASSTLPSFGGDPLCITGNPNGGTPVVATLEVCAPASSPARWNQLWSWEGGGHWIGQNNPISNGYSYKYLSSGSYSAPTVGTKLYVWDRGGNEEEWGSFAPEARVGAGAAGYATHQIVNYFEFGRCADVTRENVWETQMILYPCKQDPNPSQTQLKWNHKWYYTEPSGGLGASATQLIYVYNWDGSRWCMQSPGTVGGWVKFTNACNINDKSQQWTRYADMGSYDTSYTFHDGYGRCLDVGPAYHTTYDLPYSTMIMNNCSSSLSQKWNAPANIEDASLNGYWELP